MRFWRKAVLYGFLVWLAPFVAAAAVFPVRRVSAALFDSVMAVVLAGCVVFWVNRYYAGPPSGGVNLPLPKESLLLGGLWLGISLLLDWPLFSRGPMAMTLAAYLADIGVTYLMIPVITTGAGLLLARRAA